MTVKILELKPNGEFIHPEFNGYKLSLDAIPTLQKKLDIPADKVFPDSNQYSFLHAKLIGLHNHLIGETIEGIDTVYVVDKSWCIKKVTVDNISEKEIQITPAFDIPKNETRPHADYDVCLKLVTESLAVLSDGMGKLHILKTDNRKQNNYWKCLFSEDILDNGKSFVIQDARFQKSNEINNIHCLLYDIQQRNDRQHFSGILYWVKLSEVDNIWKKSHLKEISCDTNSVLHYAYLETSCEALYIISDGCFRFILNSDKLTVTRSDNSKKYCWSQTLEDITIQFKLPINMNMDSLCINTKPREISVKVNGHNVLNGELCHKIDHSLTNWSVENDILEVRLTKQNEGHTWTSIIPDDDSGEYVVDPVLLSEVQERLSHLCSENEVITTHIRKSFTLGNNISGCCTLGSYFQ